MQAVLTTLQVITLDSWGEVLGNASVGGSAWLFFYFFALVFVGNWILFNMCVS